MFCEIWGCHSDIAADSCLLGYDAVVSDILKDHIKWIIVPSLSESVQEHGGTMILHRVWIYTSPDTSSQSEGCGLKLNYCPINSGLLPSVSILHILHSLKVFCANFLAPEKMLFVICHHLTFKKHRIHICECTLKISS